MKKEEIVKFLMWLGDCYEMNDKENAESCATNYLKEIEQEVNNNLKTKDMKSINKKQVIEHFKNAKAVKCLADNSVHPMEEVKEFENSEKGSFYTGICETGVFNPEACYATIYDCHSEIFAEIVELKDINEKEWETSQVISMKEMFNPPKYLITYGFQVEDYISYNTIEIEIKPEEWIRKRQEANEYFFLQMVHEL
jgi:hypothetical protein